MKNGGDSAISYTLEDYRRSHLFTRLLLSSAQGWYARENILQQTGHPGAYSEGLNKLDNMVQATVRWNDAIQPDKTPLLLNDGTVLMTDESVKQVSVILMWFYEQYGRMNNTLNAVLDDQVALHERADDVSYIIASIASVYYATNHRVRADLDFARRFDDTEIAAAREGDLEESEKELDFVDIVHKKHLRGEVCNPEVCSHLIGVIESIMDNQIRATAMEADKYLCILGK